MAEVDDPCRTKPKRRRICLVQSKNGCLTCKARRVKCDEARPQCKRCERAERLCRGYEDQQAASPRIGKTEGESLCSRSSSTSIAPEQHLSSLSGTMPIKSRHTRLGLNLFAGDASSRADQSSSRVAVLVLQRSHSSTLVSACAHALGLVYKLQCHGDLSVQLEASVNSAYGSCLRLLRQEIDAQPTELLDLTIACIHLVAIETLFGQPRRAMLHLQAAHGMLAVSKEPARVPGFDPSDEKRLAMRDELELFFQSLDIQIYSFMWDYSSTLPKDPCPSHSVTFWNIDEARVALLAILRACGAWMAENFRLKYSPAFHVSGRLIEQGRHISALSMWLEQFSIQLPSFQATDVGSVHAKLEQGLLLRIMCLSWLIRLCVIFEEAETSYDRQQSRFERIVLDAEQVILIRATQKQTCIQDPIHGQAIFGIGMIEPLYVVAAKYRSVEWRFRAIHCLENAGLELPFSGPREAAIGRALAKHETLHSWDRPQTTNALGRSCHQNNFGIPESERVHGCRITEDGFLDGRERVVVTFLRCNDLDNLRDCSRCQNCCEAMFENECHWKMWKEEIRWQPSQIC